MRLWQFIANGKIPSIWKLPYPAHVYHPVLIQRRKLPHGLPEKQPFIRAMQNHATMDIRVVSDMLDRYAKEVLVPSTQKGKYGKNRYGLAPLGLR